MYHWIYSNWLRFQQSTHKDKALNSVPPTLEEVITHQQQHDYSRDVIIEVRGGFVSSSPARVQGNNPT